MPARSGALSGVGCNKYRSAIKPSVVPYAAKLYAYIFVANVLAVVIVVQWVKPVGFMVSMAFGLVFAAGMTKEHLARQYF